MEFFVAPRRGLVITVPLRLAFRVSGCSVFRPSNVRVFVCVCGRMFCFPPGGGACWVQFFCGVLLVSWELGSSVVRLWLVVILWYSFAFIVLGIILQPCVINWKIRMSL